MATTPLETRLNHDPKNATLPDSLQPTSEFLGDLQVPDESRREVVYHTMHPDRLLLGISTYPLVQLTDVLYLHLDVFFDHDPQCRFFLQRECERPDAIDERGKPTRNGVIGVLGVLIVNVVAVALFQYFDVMIQRVAESVVALVVARRVTRFFHRRDRTTAVLVADDDDCVHTERGQNRRGQVIVDQ